MTRQRGFTLVEILITLVIFLFLTAGVMTVFVANKRVETQDDIALSLDANLRAATTRVTRHLRNAGYGVPGSNLGNWIP